MAPWAEWRCLCSVSNVYALPVQPPKLSAGKVKVIKIIAILSESECIYWKERRCLALFLMFMYCSLCFREHRVQLGMWLLLEGHIAHIFKDCELSSPFYWMGPRLNLKTPLSVIPFWNRLDETIQMSVVLKSFTELPWKKLRLCVFGVVGVTRAPAGAMKTQFQPAQPYVYK